MLHFWRDPECDFCYICGVIAKTPDTKTPDTHTSGDINRSLFHQADVKHMEQ
jgi:hypothetical protein